MDILQNVIDRALRLLPKPVRHTNQSPPIQPVLLRQIIKPLRVLPTGSPQLSNRLLMLSNNHFHLLESGLVTLNIRVPHALFVRDPALHDPD